MTRILLIESDPGERLILGSRMADRGYEVTPVESGAEGLAEARSGKHDVVLLCADLEPGEAAKTCRRIKAVPHLQLLPVHQLQPKRTDKVTTEISRLQLQLDRLIIQRLGKNTTRKWVKQFLLLLGPRQVVSRIIVQPGLSTIDSKQRIMPRQVPRGCRSILQHLRANNKKWTIQYLLHCVGEKTFVKYMDADDLMKILILFLV